jgi:hypothetical protein
MAVVTLNAPLPSNVFVNSGDHLANGALTLLST